MATDPPNSNKMRLTLGSAVRGGKFLQTQQREWPLRTMEEDGKADGEDDRECLSLEEESRKGGRRLDI